MLKQRIAEGWRGGGGDSGDGELIRLRARLSRFERMMVVTITGFNVIASLNSFTLWCTHGSLLSLLGGFINASFALWLVMKNRRR